MSILVQKFGGTSLATQEKRQLAVKKISEALHQGYQLVVVVSAMGRQGDAYATDTLLKLIDNKSGSVAKRDQDLLVSCGEVISAVVMAYELGSKGIKSTCLTGAQAGIVTDDNFTDASIIQIKPGRILTELNTGKVVVVTGFQGVTQDGMITTLGRGGSDTTAAALGVALRAECIEIYTDVNGVKTADPRIVSGAKTLAFVTYNEVCQLAHEGAKVIHPRAVEIAMQGNIPLKIKNTFTDEEGTLVGYGGSDGEPVVDIKNHKIITGITQKTEITQLIVNYDRDDVQMVLRIFRAMALAEISLDFISIGELRVVFTVKNSERDKAIAILNNHGFSFDINPDCAKIAAVGAGMTGVPGVMANIVEALTDKGIRILQSADSYTSIWCLVKQQDLHSAIRALHEKFYLG